MKKKPETPKPKTRQEGERKSNRDPRLPLLLDFTLILSKACVGIVGGLVALISILGGAPLWTAALRSGTAMVVTGLLWWLFNWFLLRKALEIAIIEMARRSDESPQSTISRRA